MLKTKGKQGRGDTGPSSPAVALSHGRNHGLGDHCEHFCPQGHSAPGRQFLQLTEDSLAPGDPCCA